MNSQQGGCLCGAVRYLLLGEPRGAAICHCSHCKKQSGSQFSFNLIIKEADYQQQGSTTIYIDDGDSGQPVYRNFCNQCGSPLFVKTMATPGKLILKGGTLDMTPGLLPAIEIYCDNAVAWLPAVPNAARYGLNI